MDKTFEAKLSTGEAVEKEFISSLPDDISKEWLNEGKGYGDHCDVIVDDDVMVEIKSDNASKETSNYAFEVLQTSKRKSGSMKMSGFAKNFMYSQTDLDNFYLYVHKGYLNEKPVWFTFTMDAILEMVSTCFVKQATVEKGKTDNESWGNVVLLVPQDKVMDFCNNHDGAFCAEVIDEKWYINVCALKPTIKSSLDLNNFLSSLNVDNYSGKPIFEDKVFQDDKYIF